MIDAPTRRVVRLDPPTARALLISLCVATVVGVVTLGLLLMPTQPPPFELGALDRVTTTQTRTLAEVAEGIVLQAQHVHHTANVAFPDNAEKEKTIIAAAKEAGPTAARLLALSLLIPQAPTLYTARAGRRKPYVKKVFALLSFLSFPVMPKTNTIQNSFKANTGPKCLDVASKDQTAHLKRYIIDTGYYRRLLTVTPITLIIVLMVNNRSGPGQKHGHRRKSSFSHQIIRKTSSSTKY